MKNVLWFVLLFVSTVLMAQTDCKVLVENLSESYVGKCKNGLAHGKGLARGIDTYKGKFREGYPDGKGTYTYADGSIHIGDFKKGRRDGKGKYSFMADGKEMLQEGYWKDDSYVGPVKPKAYKIKMKRNIDRYTVSRVGEGDDIRIFLKQNGRNNSSVTDMMITASSGDEMTVASNFGYKNVEFPFTIVLRYQTANKIRTASMEVLFELEIIEPGNWNVTIHN